MMVLLASWRKWTSVLVASIGLAACGPTGDEAPEEVASVPASPSTQPGGTPPPPSPPPATPATTLASSSLAWDPVIADDLAGYRVYYGKASGSYEQASGSGVYVGKVTSATLAGLERGTRYYFAVTALDFAGNESAPSGEVNRLID